MEFKYHAIENRATPISHPLPTVAYVSGHSLRGYEFAPGNVPPPNVFRTPVLVNSDKAIQRELEKEQIRRELEKEEIRREIISGEMARRRELEEEVRREMASERALGIPMQRLEGFSIQRVSILNHQRMNNPVNHINIFGGPHPQLPSQVDIRQPSAQMQIYSNKTDNNKDNVIILAKPDPEVYCAKCKAVTPSVVDDDEHGSLQKKLKQEWSCALCQVSATSEKGLTDHLQGKKHKAKEMTAITQRIGLDARPNRQKLQPCLTSADTNIMVDQGVLESKKENQVVQKSQGIDALKNENETNTGKEAEETNALTSRKKLKFWCAICQVETYSEIVMQTHKNGKKHLANMKKFSQHNVVANSR